MQMTWIIGVLLVGPLAAEPITLDNAETPTANRADEPVAKQFSLASAVKFLDHAALDWTKQRKCFACHTNYAYLMARPTVGHDVVAHRQVRLALEDLVEKRWADEGPRWPAEVIQSAMILAWNDAVTTGKLQPTTRKALDRMWTLQRKDGGFDWLKCGWPPMESDDHFGATIALLGVGIAPEGYAKTPAAQQGVERIRQYLKANPPPTLHHAAMVAWASVVVEGVLSDAEKEAVRKRLLAAQKADGGWNLASLVDWKRADKKAQDLETSDGYATGFAIFVLRQLSMAAAEPALQRGCQWLKQNQRESGRWYSRSPNRDSKHYISHAGTSFALLALDACGEMDRKAGRLSQGSKRGK